MNALEKLADLLVAVLLLFLLPVLYYESRAGVSEAMLAGQAGENFLKRVSTAGEVTMPVWKELETSLLQYGCETFTFQRERRLYEPVEKTGKVVQCRCTIGKQEIIEEMEKEGKIRLLPGDRLWLTVYRNEIPAVYFTCVRTEATDS